MERIPEPELMDDPEQARAYAMADFEEPHSMILETFAHEFPDFEGNGAILDLGCGPGDITFRFAHRFPSSSITGVDGSGPMIELARRRNAQEGLIERVRFIKGLISGAEIPKSRYDLITSNSLLHHLRNPHILWECVREHSSPGTIIFVVDLFRPESMEAASRLVSRHAGNEPEVLRRDFYNSLLAAFTPDEVQGQLGRAGLAEFAIREISDRHLCISGRKR